MSRKLINHVRANKLVDSVRDYFVNLKKYDRKYDRDQEKWVDVLKKFDYEENYFDIPYENKKLLTLMKKKLKLTKDIRNVKLAINYQYDHIYSKIVDILVSWEYGDNLSYPDKLSEYVIQFRYSKESMYDDCEWRSDEDTKTKKILDLI